MTRPLFLLLAYRQEEFAADAVRAALGQKGPALDILISDDCSPDGTWDVIENETRDYSGPHSVRINRNERNLGVSAHIDKLLSETTAEHVIVGAADDIPHPERAMRQLEAFSAEGVVLVHSDVTSIDASGAEADFRPSPKFLTSTAPEVAARSLGLYVGATGAWHRSLWTRFPKMRDGVFEDLIFGFRAALIGRIAYIDAPLVRYRVNLGQSAIPEGGLSQRAWTARRRGELERGLRSFQQRRVDAEAVGEAEDGPVMRVLLAKEREYRARLDVVGRSFSDLATAPSDWSFTNLRCWTSERRRARENTVS